MLFKRRAKQYTETIGDKLQNASLMGVAVRRVFSEMVEKLIKANEDIDVIREEAEVVVKSHQSIIDGANMEKLNNLTTIRNLQKVIGVEEQIND